LQLAYSFPPQNKHAVRHSPGTILSIRYWGNTQLNKTMLCPFLALLTSDPFVVKSQINKLIGIRIIDKTVLLTIICNISVMSTPTFPASSPIRERLSRADSSRNGEEERMVTIEITLDVIALVTLVLLLLNRKKK
jgi:hypothetical protein